jgi:TatD DNase family protein
MRLVDSHGHLNSDRFDGDVEQVIGGARLAGLERCLVPGWNRHSSLRALELAETRPWLDAAVGIHPHDAAKVTRAEWAEIVQWAADARVVAIGETGLDSDRMFSPWPSQLDNLRRNLALALATGKPAILHCRSRVGERDSQDALVAELRAAGFADERAREAFGERPPAIIHSFSGPVDYAAEVVAMGFAVSFSGLVFRRGEESSASAVALVPSSHLLVETDAPFLAPPGSPPGRNQPANVAITARWVAAKRGVSEDDAAGLAAFGDGLVAAYDVAFRRSRPRHDGVASSS